MGRRSGLILLTPIASVVAAFSLLVLGFGWIGAVIGFFVIGPAVTVVVALIRTAIQRDRE